MTESWSLSGDYFDTCNCAAACPCVFLSPPTEGDCKALVAWHIESGTFGSVKLDGLNVALAVHAPGVMAETKWKVAVFLDARCDAAQEQALTTIFSGQAGGHPAVLASFVGEIVGMSKVPIEFRKDGKGRSLTLGKVGSMNAQPIEGQEGALVTVENHPFAVSPGHKHVVAKTGQLQLKDGPFDWSYSGTASYIAPFTYANG